MNFRLLGGGIYGVGCKMTERSIKLCLSLYRIEIFLTTAIALICSGIIVFGIFSGKLLDLLDPHGVELFRVIYYKKDPALFWEETVQLIGFGVILFVCRVLGIREMKNFIKFEIDGVSRPKEPYSEIWRLKLLVGFMIGILLIIAVAFYPFFITF